MLNTCLHSYISGNYYFLYDLTTINAVMFDWRSDLDHLISDPASIVLYMI